jgi:oligosaccharide repeat unit polymerase
MNDFLGQLLFAGIAEHSALYLISAALAISATIVPVMILFFMRNPLFLLTFPGCIYIFGPLLGSLTLSQTPLSGYVFPETALEQTWLISYAIWLTIGLGHLFRLHRMMEECISSPLWRRICDSTIFWCVALAFAAAFLVFEIMVFHQFGASVLTGEYTGFSYEDVGAYVSPIRSAATGSFYGAMLSFFMVLLSRETGAMAKLYFAIFAGCCVIMLIGGNRLQFIQIAVALVFVLYWRRQIGFATVSASGITLLGVALMISILRIGVGGSTSLSLFSIFLPIASESALNALTYNIAYSSAAVRPFNFGDVLTFFFSTLFATLPGSVSRALDIAVSSPDKPPMLIPFARYIGNFSPIGSFSVFATVGYVFKSFFWPVTLCVTLTLGAMRSVPGRLFPKLILLSAVLTSLSFWRDPFTIWWRVFTQNIFVVLFIVIAIELLSRRPGLALASALQRETPAT